MTYLVDTDILIDIARGKAASRQLIDALSDNGVAISGMTYGELWEGIVGSSRREQLEPLLEQMLMPFEIYWLDREIMRMYGELRVFLRGRGQLLAAPDARIAATALRHQLTLVTRNHRHFRRIPDLQLVTPANL